MRTLLTLFILFLLIRLEAQVEFESRDIRPGERYFSGVAIAVTDINNDFMDDIIHLDNGRILYVEYQTAPGKFDWQINLGNNDAGGVEWSMAVSDLDNDGFKEVMNAGGYNQIRVYSMSDLNDQRSEYVMPLGGVFSQASNMVDINNDGHLDVFVCHDDAFSVIGLNNGDGTFRDSSNYIDMSTTPASDGSGNYGSVWSDVDSDGDIDLYIAKCRQGVDNPNDGRRINQLFINNGDGTFKESATAFGLDINAQSWTGEFGDIDNDGDFDGLVTNHYAPSNLMINIEDTVFVDESVDRGMTFDGFPIQGLFRDFDNDGFLDIIITGTRHHLFFNNGDGTFTKADNPFDANQVESLGIGDLNDDGFLDFYAGYAEVFNIPSSIHDRLWINQGNTNNWVKLKLVGVQSNADGVGARIEMYSELGRQTRELRAGESYGITNSHIVHFGLGQDNVIDSCVIYWPSGIRQVIFPDVNNKWIITEGLCMTQPGTIEHERDAPYICGMDSLEMSAGVSGALEWNTGDTTTALKAYVEGLYRFQFTEADGCIQLSLPLMVQNDPDEGLEIFTSAGDQLCSGEEVVITATESSNYLWNTGDTIQKIAVSQSGQYYVNVDGVCRQYTSDTLTLAFNNPEVQSVRGDTIQPGETGVLTASGDRISWYPDDSSALVLVQADTLSLEGITTDTVFYVQSEIVIPGETISGGEEEHRGGSFLNGPGTNGGLVFDVLKSTFLSSVTVYADVKGARSVLILNDIGGVVWNDTFQLIEGENVLAINAELEPGNDYVMTTDVSVNFTSFGQQSPILYRNQDATDYPYQIGEDIVIQNSLFGTEYYYYFYNWTISRPDKVCSSNRVPVALVVDSLTDVDDPLHSHVVNIFPNPFGDHVQVSSESGFDELTVYDFFGRRVFYIQMKQPLTQYSLNTDSWSRGLYVMEVSGRAGYAVRQLIKQ